jgi:Cu-processing system ATP-binding protein
MIEIRGLKKSFGTRVVLNDLNLAFRPGTITGLAGPNACGKTTLLKCILGLALPDSGAIFFNGTRLDSAGEFKRRIGYMPQNPNFPSNLCLDELTSMLEDIRGETASERESLISLFGLKEIRRDSFGTLSGGTKQKIAAVLAFMFDTPLIVLDEPTAGLDPFFSVRFKDLMIAKAKAGKTILLVSHFLNEIQDVADDLVFLDDGRSVYSGSLHELLRETKEPTLERALTSLYGSRKKA